MPIEHLLFAQFGDAEVLLPKDFQPQADRPLAPRGHRVTLVNTRYSVCVYCSGLSFPRSLILALFTHRRQQPFVQAPAFNRLTTFEIALITFDPSHLGHIFIFIY